MYKVEPLNEANNLLVVNELPKQKVIGKQYVINMYS